MGHTHLEGLAIDFVGPSTVVSEARSRLGDLGWSAEVRPTSNIFTYIKAFGSTEHFAVVQGLERGQDVEVSLHQLCDTDAKLSPLKTGDIQAPLFEGGTSSLNGVVDIGRKTFRDGDDLLTVGGVDDAVESISIAI
jgi:hypothetical protein